MSEQRSAHRKVRVTVFTTDTRRLATANQRESPMKLYQRLATLVQARLNCLASGNNEWRDRHQAEIERLAKNYLPSGSGFDNGTTVDLGKSHGNKLVLQTAFHHMDEYGGYDGWNDYTVTVNPDLASGFDLEIWGVNRNDIKDYMAEHFGHVLDEDVPNWLEPESPKV